MAERHRSKDGKKETEAMLGEDGKLDQQGRGGGRLSRAVGTKDELKRAYERPAGATRVTRSMEQNEGRNDG